MPTTGNKLYQFPSMGLWCVVYAELFDDAEKAKIRAVLRPGTLADAGLADERIWARADRGSRQPDYLFGLGQRAAGRKRRMGPIGKRTALQATLRAVAAGPLGSIWHDIDRRDEGRVDKATA